MLNTTMSDSGEYTCVVSNDAGSVQSSSRVQVQARKEIETDFYSQGIRQVEMKQESMTQQKIEIEAKPAKPEFVKPLNDVGDLGEGSNVHLEAQVNPVSDHTMAIGKCQLFVYIFEYQLVFVLILARSVGLIILWP